MLNIKERGGADTLLESFYLMLLSVIIKIKRVSYFSSYTFDQIDSVTLLYLEIYQCHMLHKVERKETDKSYESPHLML